MNTSVLRQTWTVSAVLISMFAQGMVLSYPTSLVPGLRDPNSSIKADLNTASWLASSVGLACLFGGLLSAIMMDYFGRKIAHIVCTLPGMIGWLIIYFGRDILEIMCGRVLGGITTGAAFSLGAIVIGEYTSPKYRGVFLNLKTAGVSIGGMFVHLISYSISWRRIALIAAAPYAITLLITFTWAESPAWLASKQDYEGSKQAFFWLRGKSDISRKEFDEFINAQSGRSNQTQTIRMKIVDFLKKFTKKDFLKPLYIAVVGSVLLEACGRHIFPAYAKQIIGEVTKTESESFYYTLGLDIIITVSALSSSILVKMLNRRTLLLSTGFAAVSVLFAVCTYLQLAAKDIISQERSWIPISLFVLYFILANLGCTPIPLTLLGEIFPLPHRGVGSALSGVSIALCLMVALQLTPHMLFGLGVHGMFAVFGTIMFISLIILYMTLPETKDKTLQQIENYFIYGSYEGNVVIKEEKRKMMQP